MQTASGCLPASQRRAPHSLGSTAAEGLGWHENPPAVTHCCARRRGARIPRDADPLRTHRSTEANGGTRPRSKRAGRWREDWDSNPGAGCLASGFQGRLSGRSIGADEARIRSTCTPARHRCPGRLQRPRRWAELFLPSAEIGSRISHAAGAAQPHLRARVVAGHGRVQAPEPVHLRFAEERVDQTGLEAKSSKLT